MDLVELQIPSIKQLPSFCFHSFLLGWRSHLEAQEDSIKSPLAKLGTQGQDADGGEWQLFGDRRLAVQRIQFSRDLIPFPTTQHRAGSAHHLSRASTLFTADRERSWGREQGQAQSVEGLDDHPTSYSAH